MHSKMKVIQINANDGIGGAARAATRLHMGLCSNSVDSQLLVQKKYTEMETVVGPKPMLGYWRGELRPHLDALPVCLYPDRTGAQFSPAILPGNWLRSVKTFAPEIVHLHWICNGLVRLESLRKLKLPIVWTLHDFWAFTGGCHYAGECDRYRESCGACPQLGSSSEKDLSRWVWNRKAKSWRDLDLTVITPSQWLADCARNSRLFSDVRVEVIPNGIDTHIYKPLDKAFCRELLQLPQNQFLVLFGSMNAASDQRKGFKYLQAALKRLAENGVQEGIELVVFGASTPANPPDMGFPVHYLGMLHDEYTMAALYSSADVVVSPSTEDNLPNVVMEALSCGTPCVAFNVGGMPDMIDHLQNGFLATPFEIDDLTRGMKWVQENGMRRQSLAICARAKVEAEFELEIVSRNYLKLYEEILSR